MKNGTPSKAMGPQWDANKASGLTDADLDKLANWLAMQKKKLNNDGTKKNLIVIGRSGFF